jgi:hypothetical protein
MMITNFNKRKCLLREIVKIPELCCATQGAAWREEEVQFGMLLNFFGCMNFESLFRLAQRVLLAVNEARLCFFFFHINLLFFPRFGNRSCLLVKDFALCVQAAFWV